ncbi:MAG: hypothetical protein GY717_01835 [Rhodobacteraceae bacterium]|nr:hypothetical protein [Paracoccaceae bacterium]
MMRRNGKTGAREWRSLKAETDNSGYSVFESECRFRHERFAEHTLRLTGVFLILAASLQWFRPAALISGSAVQTSLGLTALFGATGLALYFFASRGFRRMIRVDLGDRRIRTARVDSRNRTRPTRQFALGEIESVYIKRGDTAHAPARLELRLRGGNECVPVLTGDRAELEELHALLCRDVRHAMDCSLRRVNPGATASGAPTRARPDRRARLSSAQG